MANGIAIVGDTGSGKSTSLANIPALGIKGLEPKEINLTSPILC